MGGLKVPYTMCTDHHIHTFPVLPADGRNELHLIRAIKHEALLELRQV